LLALLQGCASKDSAAPRPELLSSGWSDPSTLTPGAHFDAYALGVTQELRIHRLPFDAAKSDAELTILIHGLSDTAFAMRDLANSLSRLCFESRVLLLPGHGTRPADLMVVDHKDWLAHVEAAVAQARRESERVVLAGFSLGAALALAVAAESPEKVDAVIGLSPAYRLRSNFLARQARWVAAFRPWLDLGPREDFARYGAMPTRGIASTMAVLAKLDDRVRRTGSVKTPWLVVQSEDDEVVDVAGNRWFFDANADDPRSVFVNYFSDPPKDATRDRVIWLPAAHDTLRVVGLSHLAVHVSPDNPHYGVNGTYRNCGSPPSARNKRSGLARRRSRSGTASVGSHRPLARPAPARRSTRTIPTWNAESASSSTGWWAATARQWLPMPSGPDTAPA